MLKLSPRLQCIADYICPGDRVIDVGTDHAYIPIYLLQNGIARLVTATDIRSGPLENAAADARKYQVAEGLTLLLCDGLSACTPEMADTVILAGMGGETIQHILAAAPWALEKRLLLQPQSKQAELRAWLAARGLSPARISVPAGRSWMATTTLSSSEIFTVKRSFAIIDFSCQCPLMPQNTYNTPCKSAVCVLRKRR